MRPGLDLSFRLPAWWTEGPARGVRRARGHDIPPLVDPQGALLPLAATNGCGLRGASDPIPGRVDRLQIGVKIAVSGCRTSEEDSFAELDNFVTSVFGEDISVVGGCDAW